jgi:DNA-binding NarL/FixJ family response regulator
MCNVVGEVFTDALVQECEDIASALQQLEQGTIDLVLLDLSMPDADGIEGLSRLRAAAPATPVIVCSARDDPALVRDCFKLGIAGYLPKSSGMEVTREVDGAAALTPRQRTVLALLERGMSNKAIARELGIGEITVKAHVSAILRKLGVENRLQAIIAVREKKS